MKKILSLFTVFIIAVSVLAVPAFAYDLNDTPHTETDYLSYLEAEVGGFTHKNYVVFMGCYPSQLRYYLLYFYSDEDSFADITLTSDTIEVNGSPWYWSLHTFYNTDDVCKRDRSGGPFTDFFSTNQEGFTDGYRILYSTVPIYDENGKDIRPSSIAIPFTVSYTPELYEGMKREVSYPSKSGGMVTSEFNAITINIKLTEDFLNITDRYTLDTIDRFYFDYSTYSFLIYLLDEKPTDDNFSRLISCPFYTHLNYGSYINSITETDIDGDNGNMVDHVETLAKGITPIWYYDRDSYSLSAVIQLNDIDFNKLQNNELYLCVTGVFNTNSHGQEDKYQVGNYGIKDNFYSNNFSSLSNLVTKTFKFYNDNDEIVHVDIPYYSYYTVVSDMFNFVDYPEFSGGQTFYIDGDLYQQDSTRKSIDSLLDIPYHKITDNDILNSGGGDMSAKDYDDYLKNKQWSNNFMTDFSVGDIKSIFDGTSSFYQFLTASISILPSWFMTILASFFVVMLAIVVVKMVI